MMKSSCLCCGNCCTQFAVCMNNLDVKRIARHTGKKPEQFIDTVSVPLERERDEPAVIIDGSYCLLVLKRRPGEVCIFYDKHLGCSIHKTRPMLCRCYPFIYTDSGIKELSSRSCPKQWIPEGKELGQYKKDCKEYKKQIRDYHKLVKKWNENNGGSLIQFLTYIIDA